MTSGNPEKHHRLGEVFNFIASNASEFDQHCQLSLETTSGGMEGRLRRLESSTTHADLDILVALTYRFVMEFNISTPYELPTSLVEFTQMVRRDVLNFEPSTQDLVNFATSSLPVAILKRVLNSEKFGSLRNVSSVSDQIEQTIEQWEERLEKHESTATRLNDALARYSQAFNFVGLQDGFKDLSDNVKSELFLSQVGIFVFGTLVLVPASLNIWLISTGGMDLSIISSQALIVAGTGSITITLLFLYFFRITLRKADSCRAQLLQLGLRMSLCRFIQSYADYSTEIRKNNPAALEKFEALIFSGLVESADRLPTTFDGIDQLTSIIKAVKSKD